MKVRINNQEITDVTRVEVVRREYSDLTALLVVITLVLVGWWMLL